MALFPPDPAVRMRRALDEARRGAALDEVPVGAALFSPEGELLAAAHDERMRSHDPTAHAEILAIRQAALALGDWRLQDCELVVTLEPCPMCAGALVLSRVRRLVFGALSPKSGAVRTLARMLDLPGFNHHVEVEGGVLAEECGALLSSYFRDKRGRDAAAEAGALPKSGTPPGA